MPFAKGNKPKRKISKEERFCIPLNDDWRIVADKYNYILQKKSPSGNWKDDAYYSDVGSCLQCYIRENIRDSKIRSWADYEQTKDDLIKEVFSQLSGLPNIKISLE